MTTHGRAPGQGEEFTLCGLAEDAFQTGDADEPVEFAKRGHVIECEECLDFISDIRERFTSYGKVKK